MFSEAGQLQCRLLVEGAKVGFPVLVKAALGGGGKGMKLALQQDELEVCMHEIHGFGSQSGNRQARFHEGQLGLHLHVTTAYGSAARRQTGPASTVFPFLVQ